MNDNDYHEGRPIVRQSSDRKLTVVLCPYGHLLHSTSVKNWAGSMLEANAADPAWTQRCYGTIAKVTS